MVFEFLIPLFDILTWLFSPILALPLPLIGVAITAIIVFIITLFNKYLVDQNKIKELKDEQKSLREKAKELQKTNPEEANKVMGEMLKIGNKQMAMNFKALIPSFIVIIFLWQWLSFIFVPSVPITSLDDTNMTFSTVFNDDTFTNGQNQSVSVFITNRTEEGDMSCFILCSQKYTYSFDFDLDNDGTYDNTSLETGDEVKIINDWVVGNVREGRMGMGVVVVKLPFTLPIFYYGFGWLMWYFILSIPLISLFRKIMGVH